MSTAGRGQPRSPLDPALCGWHITPRAWRRSAIYAGLRTAQARHVAELILFDRPRYENEEHWHGAQRFTVHRGQLFDSEEALARAAGTSRKVVRTVIQVLQNAGLVARERACDGARSPWITTVRDYDVSQTLPECSGPRPELQEADGGASRKLQKRHQPHQRRRRARAKLGPLGRDLMATVAAGAGSSLSPLLAQKDADDLEAVISGCFVGVAGALKYVAQTCRERSRPGAPYVPRTQFLVLEMLRDVRPAVPGQGAPADDR